MTILKSQDPTLRRLPPIAAQLDALRSASKTPPVPEDPAVTQQLLEVVSGLAADVQALKTERAPPAATLTEKDLLHRQLEALGIKLPQKPPAPAEQVPGTLGGADEIERLVAQRVEEELRKRQSPPVARDGSANLFASSGTGSANQQLFANLSERLGGPARAATSVLTLCVCVLGVAVWLWHCSHAAGLLGHVEGEAAAPHVSGWAIRHRRRGVGARRLRPQP